MIQAAALEAVQTQPVPAATPIEVVSPAAGELFAAGVIV
jgi:hypothetical protein